MKNFLTGLLRRTHNFHFNPEGYIEAVPAPPGKDPISKLATVKLVLSTFEPFKTKLAQGAILLAAGDKPADEPMICYAIDNGGIGIVVGDRLTIPGTLIFKEPKDFINFMNNLSEFNRTPAVSSKAEPRMVVQPSF